LLNRGKTSGRSDDVNEQVIRARITEYENKTSPVAKYYDQFDKVVRLKGEGDVDTIFDALCSEIEAKKIV
jgi:adenylate kinase